MMNLRSPSTVAHRFVFSARRLIASSRRGASGDDRTALTIVADSVSALMPTSTLASAIASDLGRREPAALDHPCVEHGES